jgi:hypothetical protein
VNRFAAVDSASPDGANRRIAASFDARLLKLLRVELRDVDHRLPV